MTLWSGRFGEGPDDVLWRYTASDVDRRLLAWDVRGSVAHVEMLGRTGILSASDVDAILRALDQVGQEAARGSFIWKDGDEDVHTAVERRVVELAGPVGGKLHTGRSRNDQVALDLRLYLSDQALGRIRQLHDLVGVIVDVAESVGETVVPSYTHLQQAQAVPLAHHLLAYAWMFLRDAERFADALTRIEVSPLGAGAGGGSSLPLGPAISAQALGWAESFTNSLDAVGSRDVAAEYAFCAAQSMTHASRLAEELVLWATSEFGWVRFGDAFTTGSSALPQKKNPDIAELARGRAATAAGHLSALLSLQKGLSLAYNRDLQEDKAAVFGVDDLLAGTLEALAGLLGSATFSPPAPSAWVCALDLAEVLVTRGVPFREAHHAVGRLVATLVEDDRELSDATVADLSAADPRFEPADLELIDPTESVRRRRSPGGGSFESVAAQLVELRRRIGRPLSD
jgi:argininosuccinate lyase